MFNSLYILKGGYFLALSLFLVATIVKSNDIKREDLYKIESDELFINLTKFVVYAIITCLSYLVFTSIEFNSKESMLSCFVSISASIETAHCLYNLIGKYVSYFIQKLITSSIK